jgi:hypothetical protein
LLAYLPLLSSHRRLELLVPTFGIVSKKGLSIMSMSKSITGVDGSQARSKLRFTALEFIILLVGIPMAAWAIMWSYQGVQAHVASDSILGVTRMSAQKIDKLLCDAKSPACKTGMGSDIVNQAWYYDIDGDFLMAVFKAGNDYGKFACNPGTLACISYDGKNWNTSLNTWLSDVNTQYVKKGITTSEGVIAAMSPPNETAYTAAVTSNMDTWRNANNNSVCNVADTRCLSKMNPLRSS